MTIAASFTDARQIYGPLFGIVVPAVVVLILTVLAAGQVKTWLRRLAAWWDVRCQNAQARLDRFDAHTAERRQRKAEADIVLIDTADLDAWEADILADPLTENTEPIRVVVPKSDLAIVHSGAARAVAQGRHSSAVEVWQPRVTPLEHHEPATASLARIPGYVADEFHPQTLLGRAATFASDMRDGVEVYDEDAYAAGVIRRMHSTVDAPVSPAFGYEHRPRHALGRAEGTATQRALWEHDTGAWPVVRELVSAR